MMREFARAEDGQALVVVAVSMVVLMGALGLALDWGHGYVMRRDLQNEVDSATLAAARYVATTYTTSNDFAATVGDVCWYVRKRTPLTLELSFFSADDRVTALTGISTTDVGCAQGQGELVPALTRSVRTHADKTYTSPFSGVLGQSLGVGAAARAQLVAGASVRPLQRPDGSGGQPGIGLSGVSTLPNVAIWPIALHYEAGMFSELPCGQYCSDPSSHLISLWHNNGKPMQEFADFGQLITFSHQAVHDPNGPHQLTTESDYRGTTHGGAIPSLPNASAQACPSVPLGSWDSNGTRTLPSASECDVPNWFYYGYGGSIALGTNWADPSWAGYRGAATVPSSLPRTRSSCATVPSYFPVASCTGASSTRGDWVETLNTAATGDITSNMAQRMREFVQRYGRDVPASASQGWGRAVVVHLFLWDCAEHYSSTAARWELIEPEDQQGEPESCADVANGNLGGKSVDRVHVFTSVPFTFFENLIDPGGPKVRIKALWGDVFGEAGFYQDGSDYVSCVFGPTRPACALNPLMNSAFLVPDE